MLIGDNDCSEDIVKMIFDDGDECRVIGRMGGWRLQGGLDNIYCRLRAQGTTTGLVRKFVTVFWNRLGVRVAAIGIGKH